MFLVNLWNCWCAVLINFVMHHICWFVLFSFFSFSFFSSLCLSVCMPWLDRWDLYSNQTSSNVCATNHRPIDLATIWQSIIQSSETMDYFLHKTKYICAHTLNIIEHKQHINALTASHLLPNGLICINCEWLQIFTNKWLTKF